MVLKHSPPEFKADVVALGQSRPGGTIRSVAADLGVNPEMLRNWVRAVGANRPRRGGGRRWAAECPGVRG
ncbi:transposase [Streptomyces phaeochromogenes]